MKKVLIALAITLTTAFGATAQNTIAHINSQKVMDTMPSRKKVIADLQEIERKSAQELQEMNAAIEKAYSAYKTAQPTMSQVNREYEEGRIMKLQQNLEARQQELEASFQQMNQSMFKPIDERLRKAVENVSARKKLTYVIEESNTWYSKGGLDITNEVITELLKLEAEVTKAP